MNCWKYQKVINMESKILVTRSSMPPIEEYENEIEELWYSHWLTNMGAKHRKFQSELEEFKIYEILTSGLFSFNHL